MIVLPTLYDHQCTMRDDIRTALMKHRRAVLCAPPGTGKTVLSKYILGSYLNRPKRDNESGFSCFAVQRRGLVDNAIGEFNIEPRLPHGVIMSGRKTSGGAAIQVASIDSLVSWYVESGKYMTDFTYDMMVFDEIHAHAPKFLKFLDAHDAKRSELGLSPAFVMGLSASPQHRDLHKMFGAIVQGPSVKWLTDNGYLTPFRYFRCTQGKLGFLVKKGDDYTEESVAMAMQGLSGNLVEDWKRHAHGRATIGFFPRRKHAEMAAEAFCQAGIEAYCIDSGTPDEKRNRLYKMLNAGDIHYLANVGVIERGTNIPRVSCIQLCIASASIVRKYQIVGRGSRRHPDVDDCIVLDHAQNTRDWAFDDEIQWTLDYSKRPVLHQKLRATVECPECQAVYRGGKCKQCGYEPTKRELKVQNLEFVGGELREVQKKKRKQKKKQPMDTILVSCLYRASRSRRTMTFSQVCGMASTVARDQGQEFRLPARFSVRQRETGEFHQFRIIPREDPNRSRNVNQVYGFLKGDWSHEANPYMVTNG